MMEQNVPHHFYHKIMLYGIHCVIWYPLSVYMVYTVLYGMHIKYFLTSSPYKWVLINHNFFYII